MGRDLLTGSLNAIDRSTISRILHLLLKLLLCLLVLLLLLQVLLLSPAHVVLLLEAQQELRRLDILGVCGWHTLLLHLLKFLKTSQPGGNCGKNHAANPVRHWAARKGSILGKLPRLAAWSRQRA